MGLRLESRTQENFVTKLPLTSGATEATLFSKRGSPRNGNVRRANALATAFSVVVQFRYHYRIFCLFDKVDL